MECLNNRKIYIPTHKEYNLCYTCKTTNICTIFLQKVYELTSVQKLYYTYKFTNITIIIPTESVRAPSWYVRHPASLQIRAKLQWEPPIIERSHKQRGLHGSWEEIDKQYWNKLCYKYFRYLRANNATAATVEAVRLA